MNFDYELALQVFGKLSKAEREAILSSVNFLMSIGSVKAKRTGDNRVFGLLAVGGKDVTVVDTLAPEIIVLNVQVNRNCLYGVSIEDGTQIKLPLRTEFEFEEPTPRKPRLIL